MNDNKGNKNERMSIDHFRESQIHRLKKKKKEIRTKGSGKERNQSLFTPVVPSLFVYPTVIDNSANGRIV